jgi:hypothetical protein
MTKMAKSDGLAAKLAYRPQGITQIVMPPELQELQSSEQ